MVASAPYRPFAFRDEHARQLGAAFARQTRTCPQPHDAGGYAVSSYRRGDPAPGTIDDPRRVDSEPRRAGISLMLAGIELARYQLLWLECTATAAPEAPPA